MCRLTAVRLFARAESLLRDRAATREGAGSATEALHQLKMVRRLGLAVLKTLGRLPADFKIGPFVPPAAPYDATAELREELERLRTETRVRVTADGRRRTLGTYDDESTASRILKAFLAEVDAGVILEARAVTLAQLGAEWLDQRELHGSRARTAVRSIRGERSVWRRHVESSDLAKMAVQSIRTVDVEAYAVWLRSRRAVHAVQTKVGPIIRSTDKLLTRSMQREALRLVRQCLDEAVRRDLLSSNPARPVGVARGGRVKDLEDDWLRASEIDALLSCEQISIRDRTAYACAIGLALRLNDLKALRVEDVHLDARVPGPHVRVWISKSERFHRVPVMPWLVPWLRAQLARLPQHCEWLFLNLDGSRYAKHHDFAWAPKRERRPDAEGKRALRTTPGALERAGLDRRIRFHDLRGTCATHLAIGTWGRTWSLHEIQRMLAHTDQPVTERYVRRALDELSVAAAETRGGPASGPPLSTVTHAGFSGAGASTENRLAPGAGLEPATNRLTADRSTD